MNYYLHEEEGFRQIHLLGRNGSYSLVIAEQTIAVDLRSLGNGLFSALIDGRSHLISASVNHTRVQLDNGTSHLEIAVYNERQKVESELFGDEDEENGHGDVKAPMPGMILRLEVKEGEQVEAGHPLLVMEAMKMENEIKAPLAGVISHIAVTENQAVEKDDLLIRIGD